MLLWFLKVHEALQNFGFKQLISDEDVFIKRENSAHGVSITVIFVFVDDIIFTSTDRKCLDRYVNLFLEQFEGSDKVEVHWYLEVHLEYLKGEQKLSQSAYVQQLFDEFQLQNIKRYDITMPASCYTGLDAHKNDEINYSSEYKTTVGSLMSLAYRTRLGIATSVKIFAQYCEKPTEFLLKSLTRVFRYLKKATRYGII